MELTRSHSYHLIVVRWIDHLADTLSGSTINVALCALLAWSKLNNQVDPLVLNPTIKLAWQGIRRTRMSRARQQKAPLSEAIILAIYRLYMARFSGSDPLECLVETRTVAWLLLGFEIAPRVAELCGLTVCCYIPMLDGSAIILILEAKNNRDLAACLSKVSIAPALYDLLQFPSAAEFLRVIYVPLLIRMGIRRHPACQTHVDSVHRCSVCPKLFPTWPRDGRPPGTLSKSNITESIRDWLLALGVPREQLQRFSGVSLRRATATMAALMKVAPETTSRHFRYHSGTLGIYADKPFDQLTIEQIAGDELPNPSNDALIATEARRAAPCRHILEGDHVRSLACRLGGEGGCALGKVGGLDLVPHELRCRGHVGQELQRHTYVGAEVEVARHDLRGGGTRYGA
jgi:hypothetical protein